MNLLGSSPSELLILYLIFGPSGRKSDIFTNSQAETHNPGRSDGGVPSAVNTTQTLGSGCASDQTCGLLLPTVRDSQPQRASRGGRVTLVGGCSVFGGAAQLQFYFLPSQTGWFSIVG